MGKNHRWGSNFSVCAWAKRMGSEGIYMGIVSTGYYSNGAWELRVGREGCSSGTCSELGGGVLTQQNPEAWDARQVTMTMNTWVHICMTYDGSLLSFYTDKTKRMDNDRDSGDMNLVDLPLFIGTAQDTSGESFDGNIARVRIYSRALSAADVGEIYEFDKPSQWEAAKTRKA